MKQVIPVTNKHAPIQKMAVKTVKSSWIDEELKNWLRDGAKGMANRSGSPTDWQTYCKLRNHVTKRNKNTNKLHYGRKINYIKNDSKKLWGTLNDILGKKS
jgi:hypothetical protein